MKTIDIHTHGIGGFDTRTASRKQILKIAEIQMLGGVNEIVPTIYAGDIQTMRLHMKTIKNSMELQQEARDKFTAQAAIIGVHLEGPFLNPDRCGALNSSAFIKPSVQAFNELIEGFEDIVKIITIAPELDGAVDLIRLITKLGIIVSMGHSNATYSQAEAGFYAGARGVTHLFNAMASFHHREPGLAGFALSNKDIYVETIADPYHLHPKTIELIFTAKPPDKIIIVSDSVKETRTTPVAGAKIADSKNILIGGATTIMESARRLIQLGFNEDKIMRCVTENPARYLSHT
ncbi:MAG: amidohydrolase family protein [Nitrospirae bacterium]|nr:amidohydrolase family protein [Nitrospirota bacterium]